MILVLGTASCAPAEKKFGIQLTVESTTAAPAGIRIRAHQDIRLSDEARKALRNGVPLRVRVDLSLQKSGQWSAVEDDAIFYEIRYLPLSDRYQVSGPLEEDLARTYPRLRHAIAELATIDWQLKGVTGGSGQYSLRMRSQLDRDSMPGPMRLPMMFSSKWAHDSGWVRQEFEVGGGS